MMNSTIVGIDTHSTKNVVCAIGRLTGTCDRTTLPADPGYVLGWIRENFDPSDVTCFYESGPTGTVLARHLLSNGVDCRIVATSKLPRRTDGHKNDRRDAEWLARQAISSSVSCVWIPPREYEALSHLSHAREQAKRRLTAARQAVSSFLLLNGVAYTLTKRRWTRRFWQWARAYEFEHEADTFVLRDKLDEVEHALARLARIEERIRMEIGRDGRVSEMMDRLQLVRGIGFVTAFSLVADVVDFTRFPSAARFASYLGFMPKESSTGERVRRGGIDKKGNLVLRTLLVEAAEAASRHGRSAAPAPVGVPARVAEHARKCNDRLVRRRAHLRARGLPACKARTAIARELAEWVWHIMVM